MNPGDVVVVGIYSTMEQVEARIARIAKANPQYEMIPYGNSMWRLGPDEDEDEGFFGNKPIIFALRKVSLDNVKLG